MKTVTFTEGEGGMQIDVQQFVLNALEYRLPQIFPQFAGERAEEVAGQLEPILRQGATEEQKTEVLKALGLEGADNLAEFTALAFSVGAAIPGLGMDMIEPNAVEQVMWLDAKEYGALRADSELEVAEIQRRRSGSKKPH